MLADKKPVTDQDLQSAINGLFDSVNVWGNSNSFYDVYLYDSIAAQFTNVDVANGELRINGANLVKTSDMQAALTTKQDAAAFLTTLVSIGGTSGSGNLARVTSPTFVTPNIGAAAGTTLDLTSTLTVSIPGTIGGLIVAAGSIRTGRAGSWFPHFFDTSSSSGRFGLATGSAIAWSGNADGGSATVTSHLSQQSAGVVQIGTTAANALGSMACANVTASGTVSVGNGSVSSPAILGNATAGNAGWYFVSNSCIYATSSYAQFGIRGNFITGNVSSVFCITSGDANAGIDTCLGRQSAGVWQLGTTSNNALGSLACANVTASGTVTGSYLVSANDVTAGYNVYAANAIFITSKGFFDATSNGNWRLRVNNGSAAGNLSVGGLTASGLGVLGTYTVATLPSASSNSYAEANVSDALAPVMGSTVAAGGAVKTKVRSNGTNWTVCGT